MCLKFYKENVFNICRYKIDDINNNSNDEKGFIIVKICFGWFLPENIHFLCEMENNWNQLN